MIMKHSSVSFSPLHSTYSWFRIRPSSFSNTINFDNIHFSIGIDIWQFPLIILHFVLRVPIRYFSLFFSPSTDHSSFNSRHLKPIIQHKQSLTISLFWMNAEYLENMWIRKSIGIWGQIIIKKKNWRGQADKEIQLPRKTERKKSQIYKPQDR